MKKKIFVQLSIVFSFIYISNGSACRMKKLADKDRISFTVSNNYDSNSFYLFTLLYFDRSIKSVFKMYTFFYIKKTKTLVIEQLA